MSKYPQQYEGEWVAPVRRGFKLACCDCGLVHVMDFRVHEGQFQYRVYRDNRATGQIRRAKRLKISQKPPPRKK